MADSIVLHDDYEYFATRYVGVEYDDFVNFELGLNGDFEYEVDEIEYEVPQYA